MPKKTTSERGRIYISCLTYLAAEAEREDDYVVASILKSATANIYEWIDYGNDESPKENNDFIDSLTAAFLFALSHSDLPVGKKNRMMQLLTTLDHAHMN